METNELLIIFATSFVNLLITLLARAKEKKNLRASGKLTDNKRLDQEI